MTAVKSVVDGLDVPMWEATGEKIDLSEGEAKADDKQEAPEVRYAALRHAAPYRACRARGTVQ